MKAVPLPRPRAASSAARLRVWVLAVAALVSVALVWAYHYPPQHYASPMRVWLPADPDRELTDDERASRVVFRQILLTPPDHSPRSKIAFLFLTPGSLPFERLWEKFFQVLIIVSSLLCLLYLLCCRLLPLVHHIQDIESQHYIARGTKGANNLSA